MRGIVKPIHKMEKAKKGRGPSKPATDEVKTTASAETLKGRHITWLSPGFSGEDGEVFTVTGVDAPEWRDSATGRKGTYAALTVKGASFTTLPIGRFVRSVLSSEGILTPQGDLAAAIRTAVKAGGDQFDAAMAVATALRGVKLTLRVIPFETPQGTLGRVFEAYKDAAEAAPKETRLKRL